MILHGKHVLDAIQESYQKAVIEKSVFDGFMKSGLWPMNVAALARSRVRKSFVCEEFMPLEEVVQMTRHVALDFKRSGPTEPTKKSGFVDTTVGIEVSRAEVIQLLQSLEQKRREKQDARQLNLQVMLAKGQEVRQKNLDAPDSEI